MVRDSIIHILLFSLDCDLDFYSDSDSDLDLDLYFDSDLYLDVLGFVTRITLGFVLGVGFVL